jgi:hypothetical protein
LFGFFESKPTDKQTEDIKTVSNQALEAGKVRFNVSKVRCVVPQPCDLLCEQGEIH